PFSQQDGDVVGALVGHHQVGQPAAGQVLNGDADGVGADEEAPAAVDLGPEAAPGQAPVDQDVVAAAVGHDQVGDAVVVQVGQLDRTRGQQAVVPILEDGGRGAAVRHRDAVERL